MDAIQGISANIAPLRLSATQAIRPASVLQAVTASTVTAGLFGQSSTIVNLSGAGQLLSVAATFQDRLATFQPGTAASGIGQNFGTDVASLAAEAQFVVDAFNGVQSNLAALGGVGGLGSSSGLAAAFTEGLSSASQATFANGDSALTRLAQVGINFESSASGGNSLSIDLDTLKSAFTTDPAGAFSLLAQAADAFKTVAADTVGQAQNNFSALDVLAQSGLTDQLLGNNSLFASGNGIDFADLLLLESFGGNNSINSSVLQNLVALNQFNLVSSLVG